MNLYGRQTMTAKSHQSKGK